MMSLMARDDTKELFSFVTFYPWMTNLPINMLASFHESAKMMFVLSVRICIPRLALKNTPVYFSVYIIIYAWLSHMII